MVALARALRDQQGIGAIFTLNGSEASLRLPDPDEFGGALLIRGSDDPDWAEVEFDPGISENGRGVGLADFADAILAHRAPRFPALEALWTTAIIHGAAESAKTGRFVEVAE